MNYQRIEFSETCTLDCYIHDHHTNHAPGPLNEKHPAIIVCPGGGYNDLSRFEAEPVALTFLKEGFSTFVLNYTTGDGCVMPNALKEVLWAVWTLRKNAKEWGIDPDAIALMGFSAGAGMSLLGANHWNKEGMAEALCAPNAEALRPNAVVIGYGAANNGRLIDEGVLRAEALGGMAGKRDPHLNFTDHIGPQTPPVFIWHTREDSLIPATEAMKLAHKLHEKGVAYELHVFGWGKHAYSVANNLVNSTDYFKKPSLLNLTKWVEMCTNWLFETFGYCGKVPLP